MKSYSIKAFCTGMLLTAALVPLRAQNDYQLASGYNITIGGSSNVHDWEETVSQASGDAKVQWNADGSFTLLSLTIKMYGSSIKSEHGSIMDNKTYDALRVNSYPYITFKMTSLQSITPSGSGYRIKVRGDLTIAGKINSVNLDAMVYVKENGKLFIDGSQKLLMSDYNVDPPTAMMGAMKVSDEVTVSYKVYYYMK